MVAFNPGSQYFITAERRRNGSQPTQKALPILLLLVAIYAPARRLLEVREILEEQPLHNQQSHCTLATDVSGAHQICH